MSLALFVSAMLAASTQIAAAATYREEIPEKCTSLAVSSCQKLGYNETYVPNFLGMKSQINAEESINSFNPLLQYGCSPHLRLLLCGFYAPMCSPSGLVLPCQRFCSSVRAQCLPIMMTFGYSWPNELDCSKLPVSNSAGNLCMEPPERSISSPAELAPNRNKASCVGQECLCRGMALRVIPFSAQDKEFASVWMAIWSVVCFGITVFTLVTFLLSRTRYSFLESSAFTYPDRCILHMVGCYCMVAAGYLMRLGLGPSYTSCSATSSTEIANFSANYASKEKAVLDVSCVLVFLLLYYFTNAAAMWFAILCGCWLGGVLRNWGHARLLRGAVYMHCLAWGGPAVLAMLVLNKRALMPDQLTGTCYPGHGSSVVLVRWVMLPLLMPLLVGTLLLLLTFARLWRAHQAVNKRAAYSSQAYVGNTDPCCTVKQSCGCSFGPCNTVNMEQSCSAHRIPTHNCMEIPKTGYPSGQCRVEVKSSISKNNRIGNKNTGGYVPHIQPHIQACTGSVHCTKSSKPDKTNHCGAQYTIVHSPHYRGAENFTSCCPQEKAGDYQQHVDEDNILRINPIHPAMQAIFKETGSPPTCNAEATTSSSTNALKNVDFQDNHVMSKFSVCLPGPSTRSLCSSALNLDQILHHSPQCIEDSSHERKSQNKTIKQRHKATSSNTKMKKSSTVGFCFQCNDITQTENRSAELKEIPSQSCGQFSGVTTEEAGQHRRNASVKSHPAGEPKSNSTASSCRCGDRQIADPEGQRPTFQSKTSKKSNECGEVHQRSPKAVLFEAVLRRPAQKAARIGVIAVLYMLPTAVLVGATFYGSVQYDKWLADAFLHPSIEVFMLKIFTSLAPGIALSLFLGNNRVMLSWRQLGERLYALHNVAHNYPSQAADGKPYGWDHGSAHPQCIQKLQSQPQGCQDARGDGVCCPHNCYSRHAPLENSCKTLQEIPQCREKIRVVESVKPILKKTPRGFVAAGPSSRGKNDIVLLTNEDGSAVNSCKVFAPADAVNFNRETRQLPDSVDNKKYRDVQQDENLTMKGAFVNDGTRCEVRNDVSLLVSPNAVLKMTTSRTLVDGNGVAFPSSYFKLENNASEKEDNAIHHSVLNVARNGTETEIPGRDLPS
ncbi:uncharacterized protein LOC108672364 [Hyalella azteca]|uniref:Uncharacterized protein LOC108672364 n=1 Tax=Hyalella azteca TaxID=294128 RepID=A0A8B7NP77_HYAAZ|nr:uncharacterized protein LOC108672364 [Hyalella azteca]